MIEIDQIQFTLRVYRSFCYIANGTPVRMNLPIVSCESIRSLNNMANECTQHIDSRAGSYYLVKQTYSVFVDTPTGRRKWHLSEYTLF